MKAPKNADNKTARNVRIAECCLDGMTKDAIAERFSLSSRQVHRILKENDTVREIITAAVKENVVGLVKAIKRHDKLITADDDAVALRAIDLRYRVAGVVATHTQHPVIQNVYVDNKIHLSPDEGKKLREYAKFKLKIGLEDSEKFSGEKI